MTEPRPEPAEGFSQEKACHKRPYNRAEAALALIHFRQRKRRQRGECKKYYCPECQAWHLTSRDQRIKRKKRRKYV